MNDKLGTQIRKIRESKSLTQEEVAQSLSYTRQRYARLEKGLIDISYKVIASLAEILGVSTKEITAVIEEEKLSPVFRGKDDQEKYAQIESMINVFMAHKKLYTSMRQENDE